MTFAQIQFSAIDPVNLVYMSGGLVIACLGFWIRSMISTSSEGLDKKIDNLKDSITILSGQVQLNYQQENFNHKSMLEDQIRNANDIREVREYAARSNHDLRGILVGYEGRISKHEECIAVIERRNHLREREVK